MVRLRLLCAGLLLCLLTFNTQAVTQETYLHAASRLQFPDQLGTAKRLSVQHFEDPRLGIAVSYRIPGLGRADFYVYQSDPSHFFRRPTPTSYPTASREFCSVPIV